ncbi:Inactive ubiquitin carboxyl-terminal hydrolase 54 [Armadillidium vulgare]|nr:Inactive ubiquitin carboxyl-terminal hydrolase 54 [Armadillidium vulgare]
MSVFATLGTSLRLRDVFQSVVDDCWAQMTQHQLVGVVTYYGKHYSTFFFHTKLRVWIYFDDATVREIGPHWDQVVEKCRRGHFQPLLLLYADPNGSSVPIDSAPKMITYVSPQIDASSIDSKIDEGAPTRRALTPSPEKTDTFVISSPRRAITPNPELSNAKHNSLYDQTDANNDEVFEQNNNSSNYKRQMEAIKKTGGILPNKLNIISRPRYDSDTHMQQGDKHKTNCNGGASYTNRRGNRLSNPSLEQYDKDGLRIPDAANIPRRRDSGNWSGDRNSASSSSSTSLENPYPFLVAKTGRHSNQNSPPSINHVSSHSKLHSPPEYANLGVNLTHHHHHGNPNAQPTDKKSDQPNGHYDPGYDSYSLSSNEAFPMQQCLKHNLQKIPEGIQSSDTQSLQTIGSQDNSSINTVVSNAPSFSPNNCEALCLSADDLLEQAKTYEDAGNLQSALDLCQLASAKTRMAMEAPYNNAQSLTFARMKHNICVMRGRSLHRRILIQEDAAKYDEGHKMDGPLHSRQGSRDSQRSRSSRQGSREGSTHHSRQGSRDASNGSNPGHIDESETTKTLAKTVEKLQSTNIEIYATLPKKKLKKPLEKMSISSKKDYHSDFIAKSSSNSKEKKNSSEKDHNVKKKKSGKRSEDSDYASDYSQNKKSPHKKRDEDINAITEVKDDKVMGKKQHKIRRKLLMGGLIRRKNRSMPDLREGQESENEKSKTIDDFEVRSLSRPTTPSDKSIGGYLSEGNGEFSNPNLERSKLMRKSFHGSVGKGLSPLKNFTGLKVPPPIPQRTTSQLTQKIEDGKKHEELKKIEKRPPYPLPVYANSKELISPLPPALPPRCYTPPENQPSAPQLLPGISNPKMKIDSYLRTETTLPPPPQTHSSGQYVIPDNGFQKPDTPTQITIHVDVHQEQKANDHQENKHEVTQFTSHSRQNSEDFPPPPPPLEEAVEDLRNRGLLPSVDQPEIEPPTSLLSQLQKKCQQLKESSQAHNLPIDERVKNANSSSTSWLQELQAKQAALRKKKDNNGSPEDNPTQQIETETGNINTSVKSLTSKFENTKIDGVDEVDSAGAYQNQNVSELKPALSKELFTREYTQCNSLTFPSQSGHESRLTSGYRSTRTDAGDPPLQLQKKEESDLNTSTDTTASDIEKSKKKKMKKSVTFCDQVVLVATAEDEEEDAYIPNPILERVLKSALTACTSDVVDGTAQKLNSVHQRVGTPQSSPQLMSLQQQKTQQQFATSQPHAQKSEYSQPSIMTNLQTTTQVAVQKSVQQRMPPPYQPPPTVISATKAMTVSQSTLPQQSNNGGCQTLPNGLPSSQMPHLLPSNIMTTSPTKVSGRLSNFHSVHNHPIPQSHYHPQGSPNHLHPSVSSGHFVQHSQPSHQHQNQHHLQQSNHHHHQYPTSTHPNSMQTPSNQLPSQTSHISTSTQHRHNHVPYGHQNQYPLRQTSNPNLQQNQHISGGPGLMTRQHSSLGFSHSHHPQENVQQQQQQKQPQSQGYSPYQRVPHPNHSMPFSHTQTAPRLTLPSYASSPAVNSYSSLPTSESKSAGQNFMQRTLTPSQSSHSMSISNSIKSSTTGPTHFAGPLDPSAIYTTVNKNNKTPKVQQSNSIQPCNLCRKKAVNHPSVYCSDCNFYMSRFKPKA